MVWSSGEISIDQYLLRPAMTPPSDIPDRFHSADSQPNLPTKPRAMKCDSPVRLWRIASGIFRVGVFPSPDRSPRRFLIHAGSSRWDVICSTTEVGGAAGSVDAPP